MKRRFFFLLTVISSMVLFFVTNTFAQVGSPEYVVRVIYFLPSDRTPQPDINEKLDKLIKDTQLFYAEQMTAHGFGTKTFRFEADTAGKVVVHRIDGKFNDAYYISATSNKVWQEIEGKFDLSNNIWLIALDISTESLNDSQFCGLGGGSSLEGGALMPASGHCFNVMLTAHELGHAFGLLHDNRIYGKWITTAPDSFDPMVTSFCSAEWLHAHRYFQVNQTLSIDQRIAVEILDRSLASSSPSAPSEMTHLCGVGTFDSHESFKVNETVPGDAPPTFEMLGPPSLAAAPNTIQLRFRVSDADGLHQVQLNTPEWDLFVAGGFIACQRVSGTTATVEFVTTELSARSESVQLLVIDVHGNFTSSEAYPITVTTVLPPATAVSIPDTQLAAAIREKIGNITTHSLLNLRSLTIPSETTNLTGLEYAHNLKSLGKSGGEIVDLHPLANLTSLWVLSLSSNRISDITALQNLINLRGLDLGSNRISDITALQNLINLRGLDLGSNRISDITALQNLINLENLNLSSNQISDITTFPNLINLESLLIASNQISDITTFPNLINLRYLDLSSNQISDITTFPNLINLESLLIASNQISDITALQNLINLRHLELPSNQISDIMALQNLINLESLQLNYNQIGDITGLGNLENLGSLELSDNQISDITALRNLTNLVWLTLAENDLEDITALQNLTKLEDLSLQFNRISDITTLENLTKLKQLVLISNQVSDITALRNLTNLRILSLRSNQITDVSPLVDLVNLEILYLAGNPIEDFSPLRTLLANNQDLEIDIDIPFGFSTNFIADQTFTIGEAVNLTLPVAAGGTAPYSYALTPNLPVGLLFDAATRVLSGTPTPATPATPYTYTATDATGAFATLTFTITVTDTGPGDNLDVNSDGQVNILDLILVAVFYGTRGAGLPADVNADGIVNVDDFAAVAAGVDAAGGLPLQAVEAALLAAAGQAGDIEAIAGAPVRFGTHQHTWSRQVAYRNVAAAFADVSLLAASDPQLGKRVALLAELLQLLKEMNAIPETTALLPNYPNPFNPETWIPYHLSHAADVVLTIYNVRGDVVRQLMLGQQSAGIYESRGRAASWDGKNHDGEPVSSGVYFYTLTAGDFTVTRKLLIAK